ncbi:efflux RND transporter periplasmic adaptor subunit [Litoribrevibacter euphylliae]|uniref:Efflux RND transporter periplasmic adaptor subunit n=1 Tax=Litoribrevibacter euphylliae TaxID=1834034 RepID=A0ABV7HBR1_9GAMM
MKIVSVVFAVVLGTIVGVLVTPFLAEQGVLPSFISLTTGQQDSKNSEPEPLYWVAPMDSNYRRDKPGKSPMGMDLIPVYAQEGGSDSSPGTVSISPEVINNLGVRLGFAEMRILESRIETVGYVQYNEDALIHIHPRIQGWIEKLYVTAEGDPVKKGQPLYDIYSQELINAQEELLLALNQQSIRLRQAAMRKLRLLHVPEKSIQRLLRTRKVAENITFYAPQSGVLDNLSIREGFFVKPETTLMSIGALDEVWVEAEVFEKQAGLARIGADVTMTLDYFPGQSWQGKVDYIYPSLDAMTRTLKVRVRFDNKQHLLKPNMFASVVIHASDNKQHLMIPREAVIRTQDQDRVVLALGDGKFKSIEVTLGQSDQMYVEVLDGLEEGETVVTSAQFLLDSESSKSSDFKRMEARTEEKGAPDNGGPQSSWVEAKIESIESMDGMGAMVGATHQPIDEWGWPEMYMDFPVAESVDVAALTVGMVLHIQITKYPNHKFEISDVHIPDDAMMKGMQPDMSPMTEEVDHSGHDMSSEGM